MDRRIERTRRAVAEATVDLVARRGSQVGMTEIAEAAGVSRKAVYENFGSREQVMLQATVHLLRARLFAEGGAAVRGSESLEDLAHHLVDHLDGYRDYYSAVFSGPAGYLVTNALVVQLAGACRQLRSEQHRTSSSRLHDRFVIHGFLGVITEALVEHDGTDLHAVVTTLGKERAAHT